MPPSSAYGLSANAGRGQVLAHLLELNRVQAGAGAIDEPALDRVEAIAA